MTSLGRRTFRSAQTEYFDVPWDVLMSITAVCWPAGTFSPVVSIRAFLVLDKS